MQKKTKKKPFYSKLHLKIFRLLALVAIVILIICFIKNIILDDFSSSIMNFIFDITNLLSIFLLSIVFISPQKIGICSLISFIYSLEIILFEPNNTMGLFMYILGVVMLYARGEYNNYRKQKNIITVIVFILLNLTQLRFEKEIFFNSLVQTIGYAFVFLAIVFFLHSAIQNDFNINNSSKILNIKNYETLNVRDALWLLQIKNKVKYDAIAIESNVNLGTLKNRLKYIYSVLGVGDKQGFLNTYSTFEICYDNMSSEDLQKATFSEDGQIKDFPL